MMEPIEFINVLIGLCYATILARMVLGLIVQFMGMQGGAADIIVKLYDVIFSVTEPVLAPIRRMLPQTGMIDFSPLVLIIMLAVIQWALERVI